MLDEEDREVIDRMFLLNFKYDVDRAVWRIGDYLEKFNRGDRTDAEKGVISVGDYGKLRAHFFLSFDRFYDEVQGIMSKREEYLQKKD